MLVTGPEYHGSIHFLFLQWSKIRLRACLFQFIDYIIWIVVEII
jgi:hypothetical protein